MARLIVIGGNRVTCSLPVYDRHSSFVLDRLPTIFISSGFQSPIRFVFFLFALSSGTCCLYMPKISKKVIVWVISIHISIFINTFECRDVKLLNKALR